MKLPLEEIEGKMYQPVECGCDPLMNCIIDCEFKPTNKPCLTAPCRKSDRKDNKEVYFIEVTK